MKILKGIEAIRKRPGMYIGDTEDGSGVLNMLWEVMANALDQFLAGRCTRIDVEIAADGTIIVRDDGPGLPFELCDGIPMYERALTQLHSGPTLDGHAPHVHLGLRGVGVAVVNALSEHLEFDSIRAGERHRQRYARGEALSVRTVEECSEECGTTLAFRPDPDIFGAYLLDVSAIAKRFADLAWIYPKLQLSLTDRRTQHFHRPEGIRSFFDHSGWPASVIVPAPMLIVSSLDQIELELLARWKSVQAWESIVTFVNTERTPGHGVHLAGFFKGAVAALRKCLPSECKGLRSSRLESILKRGLQLVLCVRLADPRYASPTTDRLYSPEVGIAVELMVRAALVAHLNDHVELLDWLRRGLERARY